MHFEVGTRAGRECLRSIPNYAARGRGGEGGGEEKDSERSGRAEGRVVGELGSRGNWV